MIFTKALPQRIYRKVSFHLNWNRINGVNFIRNWDEFFRNKKKGIVFLSIINIFLIGCGEKVNEDCIDPSKISDNPCTMEYNPVCGCDEKTYGNACQAENNGILKWEPGECK